ncbi:MAG TPA: SagB/ThcOx family dehydrogenase [Fibrobacteria bacterium]|nr:SagB/ThcOx family dehydrogenase [Fibrobacteria bacterium]
MPSFTERYHELTKYRPETIDRLGDARWADQPEPFKDVPEGRSIDLIPHLQDVFKDVETPPDPLYPWLREATLPTLTRLLHCTLGLTARLSSAGDSEGDFDMFLRAAPSAGGLYPTEVYVAVRKAPDIPAGLYHYHSRRSALIPVWEGDFFADLGHHFLGHPAVAAANCVILFTGLYGRSAWRYKERAYRRILLDTGHAAANLLEMSAALGLDAVPLGGFIDEGLEELLFLGRKEECPLLGVAIGPGGSLGASGGQWPGPLPERAVLRAEPGDSMQVQQNACERIGPGDVGTLRPMVPVPGRGSAPPPAPDAGALAAFNTQVAILARRSARRFTGGMVTAHEAEDALRFAFRFPAAAVEASTLLARGIVRYHVVAFAVEGLEDGVHEYDPDTGRMTLRREGDFRGDVHAVSLGQDLASDAAFAVVYTADMEALVSRYGDRGYRYACMDCGMVGERIQLWAGQRGLGSSGIGGYYDDLANELLDLPLTHGVLYLTVVGVPED